MNGLLGRYRTMPAILSFASHTFKKGTEDSLQWKSSLGMKRELIRLNGPAVGEGVVIEPGTTVSLRGPDASPDA
jgi:hypothetical protein